MRHCHASESTVLRAFRKRARGRRRWRTCAGGGSRRACSCSSRGATRVTEVATRVGYENPSAFAAAFRAAVRHRAVARKPRVPARSHGCPRTAPADPTAAPPRLTAARRSRAARGRASCRACGPPRALRRFALIARCSAADRPSAGRRPLADAASMRCRRAAPTPPRSPAGGRRSLYLVMPDRFRDGDPSNDNATDCFDATNPSAFTAATSRACARTSATSATSAPPRSGSRRRTARPAPRRSAAITATGSTTPIPPTTRSQPELGGAGDARAARSTDMHARRHALRARHGGQPRRRHARGCRSQHPDWFHDPATCGQLGAAQVYCPLDHHPDFAQERPRSRRTCRRSRPARSRAIDVDGIRMDTAKHVPAGVLPRQLLPRGARRAPGAVRGRRDLRAGLDRDVRAVPRRRLRLRVSLSRCYAALVDAIGHGGSIDRDRRRRSPRASPRSAPTRALDLVLFVDNHDVPRFANEPGYGVPEDEIRRRLLLALDLIFTLPGIPQLYYGDELGMYGGGDPDNRRDFPAWATDPARARAAASGQRGRGRATGLRARPEADRRCARTRPRSPTARTASCGVRTAPPNPNVFAFSRGSGAGIRIVVDQQRRGAHGHDADPGARHRRRHAARRRARRRRARAASRSRAASSSSICRRAAPRSIGWRR